MSGNLRKQLGPVRKRLKDRLAEATVIRNENDIENLSDIRSKLSSNMLYHEQLTSKLSEVVTECKAEQDIIDQEIEKCIETNMEVKEMLHLIDEQIKMNSTKPLSESERLYNEKLQREIEKSAS